MFTPMGITQNCPVSFVVRFFHGGVFYLGVGYKRNEQDYFIALLNSATSVAGAFDGIFVSDPLRFGSPT